MLRDGSLRGCGGRKEAGIYPQMMNMSMHTPEYHLALESYEILIYVAWMNLENIASSEISQTEDMNDSPYMRYLE